MRNVVDAATQYERGLIRARTKAALAAKSAKGERVGSVPYGYELAADGVHLVALESEQATIAHALRLAGTGLALRAVAAELARAGRVSRTGRAFAAVQIARTNRRSRGAGRDGASAAVGPRSARRSREARRGSSFARLGRCRGHRRFSRSTARKTSWFQTALRELATALPKDRGETMIDAWIARDATTGGQMGEWLSTLAVK